MLTFVAFNLPAWLGLGRSASGHGTLAAAWQTHGGSCDSIQPLNKRAQGCPQSQVVVYQDGSYTVTTLFGTNGDTSGQLNAAQAAELAQIRANPELPSAAPADCGSDILVQHVKITVVATDGTSRTLDTCLAEVPSSNPLVQLLEQLATSGT